VCARSVTDRVSTAREDGKQHLQGGNSALAIQQMINLLTLLRTSAGNQGAARDHGPSSWFCAASRPWVYYALFTVLVLAAFALLRRLVAAWKKRSRKAIG